MADQMKITELGIDCLEHIFKKLELIDLLKVSDASKSFKKAVDLAYANKYGKVPTNVSLLKQNEFYILRSNEITINSLLLSLRLLRCFGHLIRDLRIQYQFMHEPRLDYYISEYCANSLDEIGIFFPAKEAMGNLTKPFAKCKKVGLIAVHSDNKFTDFNQWFPQMRTLNLLVSHSANLSYLDKHFPNLENMKVGDIVEISRRISHFEPNVSNLLRSNPQFRDLEFGVSLNGAFLQSISAYLQRVEILTIFCDSLFSSDGVINFERVKELTLHLENYTPNIPLSFPQLQMLTINVGCDPLRSNVLEFIHQHRSTLVKLVVKNGEHGWGFRDNGDSFKNVNKKNAAAAMELLIDIHFMNILLSINEAIELLNICKQLKKFHFKLAPNDVAKFNDSLKRIGGDWNLSTEENDHILLQR